MLVLHRPVRIESDLMVLDAEFQSARWMHHRLLDFEDEHQAVLDAAAEQSAPGIVRVGRILAKLARRAKRRERSCEGTWSPDPRPELATLLKGRLNDLRKRRNADPRWKVALEWADEQVGDPKLPRRRRAKDPRKVTRRKTETEEAFCKRFELLTTDESEEHYRAKLDNPPRDSRRDQRRKQLYANRRIYWGTYNSLLKSVDGARKAVIKRRKEGLPAEWHRPKWAAPGTLYAERGGFRIIERARNWWAIEMQIGTRGQWVRFRAHSRGEWPAQLRQATFVTAQLTRRRDGERWRYTVSLTADVAKDAGAFASRGAVAFDWGHREHGHDRQREGIRAFSWIGADGERGEVLVPTECRRLLDEIDELKGRMDKAFVARKEEQRGALALR